VSAADNFFCHLAGGKAVEGLWSEGISARFIRLDVTSHNTIAQAARRIEEEFDRLDILVNKAGVCIGDTAPSGLDLEVSAARTRPMYSAPSPLSGPCYRCCEGHRQAAL
jgi:NAD(P)-dependent dehydrogenase (short-subunit alcohol dehydrogenase family)